MLTPTDQSHFRKYLATLGVAIVVAALGLGGYMLQSPSDLLIEESKVRALTPTAREAIERKQAIISYTITYGPLVVAALVLLGLALTIYGLIGWRSRQKLVDDKEDLERTKLRVEVEKLSDEERERKAQDEAKVAVDSGEKLADPTPDLLQTDIRSKRSAPPAYPGSEQARVDDQANMALQVEHKLAEKAAAAPGAEVRTGLRIRTVHGEVYEIDALVTLPYLNALTLALEVRYVPELRLSMRVVERCMKAIDHAAKVANVAGAIPIAIFVVAARDLKPKLLPMVAERNPEVACLVYAIDELNELHPTQLLTDIVISRANSRAVSPPSEG